MPMWSLELLEDVRAGVVERDSKTGGFLRNLGFMV